MATQLRHQFQNTFPQLIDPYVEDDMKLRQQIHYSNYKFLLLDKFGDRINQDWKTFSESKLQDKCLQFFQFLDAEMPGWLLHEGRHKGFDKNIVKKNNFLTEQYKKLANLRAQKGEPDSDRVTAEDKETALAKHNENTERTIEVERNMADSMTIIRLFGHCFYNNDKLDTNNELTDMRRRYTEKMAPFMKNQLPQFDVKGTVYDKFPGGSQIAEGESTIDYYYLNLKGSGIVISGTSRHSRDIVKFIHVLRAMGNKLPIQFVFRGDLLMRARDYIATAAQASKEDLLGPELSSRRIMKSMIPDFEKGSPELEKREFPVQDITFINAQKSLQNLNRNDFGGYNNKIIALFFSTFENVLLFDSDSVPLVSPEHFLKVKEFSETGAYFFLDRTLRDDNDWIETNYFAKLMPQSTSTLDLAFGVKPVTKHTMTNRYMSGWRHCQEAGLVVINKKRHFPALFVLFALALWYEPIQSLIWGDKEMYWLAMSIAGHEDYTFNKFDAASIGEITTEKIYQHYNNSESSELCSSHPGHVSEDGKLLWINSGFSYCKKNGHSRDLSRFPFNLMKENNNMLVDLYEKPLRIRLAIVPPKLPDLRLANNHPDMTEEVQLKIDIKKRRPDIDELEDVDQIDKYGPQKGWVKSASCLAYQYCAYNFIQSYGSYEELDKSGSVFNFSPEEAQEYDLLGVIWLSALKQSLPAKQGEQLQGKDTKPKLSNQQKEEEHKKEVPNQEETKNENPDQKNTEIKDKETLNNNENASHDNLQSDQQGEILSPAVDKSQEKPKEEKKDKHFMDIFGSDSLVKTPNDLNDDNTQKLDVNGDIISEPAWLKEKAETEKKEKEVGQLLANDGKNADVKSSQMNADGRASEERLGTNKQEKIAPDEIDVKNDEFSGQKIRERPEQLKNAVNEFLKQLNDKKDSN